MSSTTETEVSTAVAAGDHLQLLPPLSRSNSESRTNAIPTHLLVNNNLSLPPSASPPPTPPSRNNSLSVVAAATPYTTTLGHSPSLSSNASSAVSRQSSCRSTTSVVAVPFKIPIRGGARAVGSSARSAAVAAASPIGGICGGYFVPGRGEASPNGEHVSTPGSELTDDSTADESSSIATFVPSFALHSSTASAVAAAEENGTKPAVEVHHQQQQTSSVGSHKIPQQSSTDRPGTGERIDPNAAMRKTVEDFTFGEILGEGSYSTVTHVTSVHYPFRSYALKVLDKEHIKREKKIKYVLIERDTLKILDGHPGIVRLYWTFQDARSLYYVLELAENGELLKWIKDFGSFALPSARYYAAQILSAIEHMHSKGVIHRDLKPENILLSGDMKVKITDFGTARVLDPAEMLEDPKIKRRRSFVGTPEYVSPEILSEKNESSPSSDYWAFGCILYQIIAGHPPFQARTEYLMFQKIIKLEYEFPEGFPEIAKDLIEKLLVLDPAARLGGSANGIEEIKLHPFFTEAPSINFSTIWTVEPPRIETGLAQPKIEQKGEFVLVEKFDDREDDYSQEQSRMSCDEDDDQRVALPLQEMIDIRRRPVERVTKWSNLLHPNETILLSSPVIDRSSFHLFSKKRTLILTDYPRLICIKETSSRVTIKCEIMLGYPQGPSLIGVGDEPGCAKFAKVEREGEKMFVVRSHSGKSSKFEESSGASGIDRWISEIRLTHASALPSSS